MDGRTEVMGVFEPTGVQKERSEHFTCQRFRTGEGDRRVKKRKTSILPANDDEPEKETGM